MTSPEHYENYTYFVTTFIFILYRIYIYTYLNRRFISIQSAVDGPLGYLTFKKYVHLVSLARWQEAYIMLFYIYLSICIMLLSTQWVSPITLNID